MGDGPRRTLQEGDSPDTLICPRCHDELPASKFASQRGQCIDCLRRLWPSATVAGLRLKRKVASTRRHRISRGKQRDLIQMARERVAKFAAQTRRRNAHKRKP